MALSLEIRGSQDHRSWTLPDAVVQQLNRSDSPEYERALRLLLGPDKLDFGVPWQVQCDELIAALQLLMAQGARGGSGFQVRAAPVPGQADMVGRSLGWFKLEGVYYSVDCVDDYWQIWRREQRLPSGIIDSPKRYDAAEFNTENVGVVRVERRKAGRKVLLRLLDDMLSFVRNAQSESFTLTLG